MHLLSLMMTSDYDTDLKRLVVEEGVWQINRWHSWPLS